MITIIFRIKIKDGKETEALAEIEKMVSAVEANEPETLAYVFHKLQDDPMQLVLFESYTEDEALQAHVKTPHFVAFRAATDDLMDTSDIQVELLERIAGVVRG
jgi:quinol monooxygenase YgiN